MANEEQQLLIDVSVLYYLEGKTQSEIAKELFISRPKVSRLLKKARDLQVVDIRINYQDEEIDALQGQVRRTFMIKNVIAVRTLSDPKETIRQAGKAAAKELEMYFHDNMTIGISWGKSIRTTIGYLNYHNFENLEIVELFGAINYDTNSLNMLSIGNKLSEKLDGKFFPLPAPIYLSDAAARKAIMESPITKNTLDKIEECDLIITGIGAIGSRSSQTLWDNYVESDIKQQITDHGGVGFILAHFFDKQGKFLDIDANESVIGIHTGEIKKQNIFSIAPGIEKAEAIHAALKGGLLNTLVSDEKTLQKVLEIEAQSVH